VPILRRHGAEELLRLPPHLTIQIPFVAPEKLGETCDVLAGICATVRPFDVTLSGYDRLPNVTALRVVNPEPIQALQRQIRDTFPGDTSQSSTFPSLVVARFQSETEQRSVMLPEYVAITFRVYRLHVVYGIEHVTLPWITFDVFRFGSG